MFSVALGNTITALADAQRRNVAVRYNLDISGPPAWSKIVFAYNITILHPHTFYPCNWDDAKKCKADRFANASTTFGMHTWAKSWQRGAQPKAPNSAPK